MPGSTTDRERRHCDEEILATLKALTEKLDDHIATERESMEDLRDFTGWLRASKLAFVIISVIIGALATVAAGLAWLAEHFSFKG